MKPEAKNIHQVLSMNAASFFIPPFQRAYAWGNQEIGRYYEDILKIIESELDGNEIDKREHFFGVLVFKKEGAGFGEKFIVVDGQQRLTTTLLLLIALRDSVQDEKFKTDIQTLYLTNANSTYAEKIKLKQVTSDWDAYRTLVNKDDNRISGKLTNGYEYFLSKLVDKTFPAMEYIKALHKINVACIFLDEKPYKGEDPQVIFETLNSLGKSLTFADLIRNYILLGMESDEQSDIYEKQWHPRIEGALGEKSSHFFRDYLQHKESKNFKDVSDNNTKELYAFFKKFAEREFKTNKTEFVDDICRYVPWYQWIIGINSGINVTNDKVFNNQLIELLRNIFQDIKADPFKPLALTLLEYHQSGINGKKLSDDQLIEALTVIRTYLIRRRVMKLSQGENKDIPKLCNKIRTDQSFINNAKSTLLNLLSSLTYQLRFPNDIEITKELMRIDFYNSLKSYSKLILGKIEEQLSKVSVDFRSTKISIEHIMPQSIGDSKNWKTEIGENWEEVHKDYLHNIGNLILTEFNSEMGNKPLEKKKDDLRKSNLSYRHDVINRSTWNKEDIEAHQSEMIVRFLDTFPLPPERQGAENWSTKSDESIYYDLFSPLEEDIAGIARGRRPKAILIDDEVYDVNSWKDLYLKFFRWLRDTRPNEWERLLNRPGDDFFGERPLFVTADVLASIVVSDPSRKKLYERLSDGVSYDSLEGKTTSNDEFVLTKQSAEYVIKRIGRAMNLAGIPEESVQIEFRQLRGTPSNALKLELFS